MEENILASDIEAAEVKEQSGVLRSIVYAGLTVGVLDAIAATVSSGIRGVPPIRVFQYVASGILGPSAYEGGIATYLVGLLCHFTVAFGASTVFLVMSRFVPFLTRMPLLIGPLYGIVVYFMMREVISPLSLVARLNYTASSTIIGLAIHMICVGLPIALITSRFARERYQ